LNWRIEQFQRSLSVYETVERVNFNQAESTESTKVRTIPSMVRERNHRGFTQQQYTEPARTAIKGSGKTEKTEAQEAHKIKQQPSPTKQPQRE